MRLKNPGRIDDAVATLQDLRNRCEQCGLGTEWTTNRDAYLQWTEGAEAQYASLFRQSLLQDALHSPAYWEIRRLNGALGVNRPWTLISGEITRQVALIDLVLERLDQLRHFNQHPGTILVVETSALLEGVYFTDFDWTTLTGGKAARLVLPIRVVEELDQTKDRDRGRAQARARSVIKQLRTLARTMPAQEPVEFRKKCTFEVLLDEPDHIRSSVADIEIIQQTLTVKEFTGQDVALVTADGCVEFRARAEGLTVHDMPLPDQGTETG